MFISPGCRFTLVNQRRDHGCMVYEVILFWILYVIVWCIMELVLSLIGLCSNKDFGLFGNVKSFLHLTAPKRLTLVDQK